MRLVDRAYAALSSPMTANTLAQLLKIGRTHADQLIRALRQAEKIRLVDVVDNQRIYERMRRRQRAVEPQPHETERWLMSNLDMWQRFMRSYWGPQGYPERSSGFPGRARITSFKDLEESSDRYIVQLMDARIDELGDKDRSAIYFCCGLTDRWIWPDHPQDAIDVAKTLLVERLRKWTAVP